MFYRAGIHLLKESGDKCLHKRNGLVLYFNQFRQFESNYGLLIFMYEANFNIELGKTIEVMKPVSLNL